MRRFAFAPLFSAVSVIAAFDEAVNAQAQAGRVHHEFAQLAAMGYGLPLVTPKGQPVAPRDAIRLAADYRIEPGTYVKGWRKQAAIGAALDALAAMLTLKADYADEGKVAALGWVRDEAAWLAALKPAPKAPKKAADVVKGAPVSEEARKPGAVTVVQGEAATVAPAAPVAPAAEIVATGQPDPLAALIAAELKHEAHEGDEIEAQTLVDTVCAAIEAGALDEAQLAQLRAALGVSSLMIPGAVLEFPALPEVEGAALGAESAQPAGFPMLAAH